MGDRSVAEISATQYTTIRHPCPRRGFNHQTHSASGRKPSPLTSRPLGWGQHVLLGLYNLEI